MAEINHSLRGSNLEGLCRTGIILQEAAEPHETIANEARAGSPAYLAAERAARELTGAAELMAGQAAMIPAGTRTEVIAKARVILALSHSAMDPVAELAASLARDVLLHLGAHPE